MHSGCFESTAYPTGTRPYLNFGTLRNLVRLTNLGKRAAASLLGGLVTLGAASAALSEPSERVGIAQLGLQRWTQESGLAGNWVRDIVRDADGAVWIATSGGLSRFDGWSFVNWPTEDALDLPMDAISTLAVGADRKLWIGFARNGVRFLLDGQVEADPRLDGFPESLSVHDLLQDSRGTLWIGTSRGLWTVGDSLGALVGEPALREAAVRHLVSRDGEEIWARTVDHGVWRIRSGRAERLPEIPGCFGASLAVGTDGSVVTACEAGVWHLASGDTRWNQISRERGVVKVFVDRNDAVWFGSRGGLTRWVDGVAEVLPADRGLGDWRIRAWLEDEDGLWIGTFSAGVSLLREGPIRAVDAAEGLPLDGATAVLARPDGTVWIGGDEDGLVHWSLRDGLVRHWTAADGLPSAPIWALAADPAQPDRLWVGTGGGLAWIEGGQVGSFGPLGIAYDDDVRLVHVDTAEPGVMWIAGLKGRIIEVRGTERSVHDRQNGLGLSRVRILHRDRQGRLLAGGDGGLYRLEGERWVREPLDGVAARSIRAIFEQTDGTLWLGGENSVLVRRGADGVQRSPFPVSPLHSLQLDSQGALWVSGNEGLFRFWISDHEDWRNGLLDEIPIHRFSRRDGLRDIETNGWGRPASARLPDGRLVYPTHGIAVADPEAIPESVLEPHEVRVLDGWSADRALELWLEPESPLHLEKGERSLRLRFSATEFIRPEAVTFRYRVEGYDDDWVASHSLREASYSHLPPGRLTFRLQARLPGGAWVESARSMQIVVEPFVWETSWFRGSLLLVALSLAYAGYRLRVGAIERRSQDLETMVARRTQSLEESESRFRALSESTFEGIVIHERGVIIESNPVMTRLLGYGPSELNGMRFLDLVAPESRRDVEERIEGGYQGAYEFVGMKRDGSRIVAETHLKSLDYRGRNLRVAAVRDVTRRKEREEELLAAKEAAEGANRAKSTFLSTMSHELRTPLSAIIGFAQLLVRDKNIEGEQRENARIIFRSGEHLLGLIDDVLEMSTIEAGRSVLTITDVDLWATIQRVEQMMRSRAKAEGLELVVERAPNAPAYVRCDEQRLRQVLINLTGNAIKFAPRGRVELRVSAEEVKGVTAARFEVTDSGLGMDPERIPEIFEPFVRSEHRSARSAGTGLGLPISREYVRRMGGDDIHVWSRPGEGSRFWFTLPSHSNQPDEHHAVPPARRVVALEPGQSEPRILVVDDDAAGRSLLRGVLTPVGFIVKETAFGKEAVELRRSWHPDAILMDIRMPETDGLSAARAIREAENGEPGSKRTLIVALTAEAFEENRTRALDAGCDDFVTKPFREAELFELLAKRLGVRYIHEDEAATEAPDREAHETFGDLASRVRELPFALLLQLEQAAAALKPQALDSVIEAIGRHDGPAAEALTALARKFEYRRIVEMARGAKDAVDA